MDTSSEKKTVDMSHRYGIADNIVEVAAMDYDGTFSSIQTGFALCIYLFFKGYIRIIDVPRLFIWGVGYLASNNHDFEISRKILFEKLRKLPADDTDKVFEKFYAAISRFVRNDAIDEVQRLQADGVKVILVSGAFDNVVRIAAREHGFDGHIAVHMQKHICDDGIERYDNHVIDSDILCEGKGKVPSFERYCNERYGIGKWRLVAAYGDHLSDRWIMAEADEPVSVNGQALALYARKQGWRRVVWH